MASSLTGTHTQPTNPPLGEGGKENVATKTSTGVHSANDSRKNSATSSVSTTAGGNTPTTYNRHRHSGNAGGIPIYVKERMEERQRKVSDM